MKAIKTRKSFVKKRNKGEKEEKDLGSQIQNANKPKSKNLNTCKKKLRKTYIPKTKVTRNSFEEYN